MIITSLKELPAEYGCRLCGKTKPIEKMVVVRLKRQKKILLRPRCKDCHNQKERGHRREWKTKYLRRWREYNSELNESYWKPKLAERRPAANARARVRFQKHHHALLIQGRLRRRLGMSLPLKEATQMLAKYGPCYPTRYGLTPAGLKECERIRSSMRRLGKRLHPVEIRMMVYEDGLFVKPARQKIPYQHAARRLRQWQATRKAA